LTAAGRQASLSIPAFLIPAPLARLVVPLAPLIGLLAAMVFTATKRTAEVSPMGVPRMGQKADSTMATVDRAACQIGMIAQDGTECQLILTNKRVRAVVLMPIRTK
jgi:hypothetical protein